jgi:hypothetical protein
MILHGFVDDSGSGEGRDRGNIFVLAGFVAGPKQWEQFSRKWQGICDREPKTPDFKMQTAIRLFREDGSPIWTQAQRDARIRQLVRLTRRKVLYRVESVLAWPNYDRIVKGKIPAKTDSPYFLCFYNIILSFASFMDKANVTGKVDWVFDDQGRIGREASKWYDFIAASLPSQTRSRMGNRPIFRHDTSVLPLKAADLYAWQIRRHLDREQPKGVDRNDYLDVLLTQVYGVSNVIEGEHLEEFVANIGRGLMLKSNTTFFLPPKSRLLRLGSRIRKWVVTEYPGGMESIIAVKNRITQKVRLRMSWCGFRAAGRMRRPECYSVRVGQFAEALAFLVLHSHSGALFCGQHPLWRATNSLPVTPGFPKSRSHPFPDQYPLELRDCAKYLEHQLAGWKGRVYRLRRGHEVNPELPEQFER